jgi:hypothetical protein
MGKMRVHIARNNTTDSNNVTWKLSNDNFLSAYQNLVGQEPYDGCKCISVEQEGDDIYAIFLEEEGKPPEALMGLFVNTEVRGVLDNKVVAEITTGATLCGLSLDHANRIIVLPDYY